VAALDALRQAAPALGGMFEQLSKCSSDHGNDSPCLACCTTPESAVCQVVDVLHVLYSAPGQLR